MNDKWIKRHWNLLHIASVNCPCYFKLPQKEVYKRLKTSGILYEYIVPSYDVLHTFSSRYLMEDITGYMREKGVLSV